MYLNFMNALKQKNAQCRKQYKHPYRKHYFMTSFRFLDKMKKMLRNEGVKRDVVVVTYYRIYTTSQAN